MSDKIMLIEGLKIEQIALPTWFEAFGYPAKPTIENVHQFAQKIYNLFDEKGYVITKDIIIQNIANLERDIRACKERIAKGIKVENKLGVLKDLFRGIREVLAIRLLRNAYETIEEDYDKALDLFIQAHLLTEIPIPVFAKKIGDKLLVAINTEYVENIWAPTTDTLVYPLQLGDFDKSQIPDIVGSGLNMIAAIFDATGHDDVANAVGAASTFGCTLSSAFVSKREGLDCSQWSYRVATEQPQQQLQTPPQSNIDMETMLQQFGYGTDSTGTQIQQQARQQIQQQYPQFPAPPSQRGVKKSTLNKWIVGGIAVAVVGAGGYLIYKATTTHK